jgi:hypothetical protein
MENVCRYIFYDQLEFFTAIWYRFVVIWYIFSILVCLDQEKSGNPGQASNTSFGHIRWHLVSYNVDI